MKYFYGYSSELKHVWEKFPLKWTWEELKYANIIGWKEIQDNENILGIPDLCDTSVSFQLTALMCRLSRVRLFATPWAVAHEALLSRGFPRQEYWTGVPSLPPGYLPNPVDRTCICISSLILYHWATWEAPFQWLVPINSDDVAGKPVLSLLPRPPFDPKCPSVQCDWSLPGISLPPAFTFTFHFHALEKEMAAHSSVLAWRIAGMGAWWAAVYGFSQSWTQLMWRSSSMPSNTITDPDET